MVSVANKCPVEAYAESVISGKVVAGRLVRLACARHLKDLNDGPKRGLKFNHDKAQRIIRFFGYLKLPEGDKPFNLQPWQAFIEGNLFGWEGPDGYRRFRTAYVEGGKGCGKTPIAAGTGLYGLSGDGEPSAEVYTAGVTRDQGAYLLRDATRLVEASPALRRKVDIGAHNLAVPGTNSFMRAVSSEGRTLDQKRVHMALVDEVHEHPTPVVIDKMRAGTKGRNQALIFAITNSGYDRTTVCWRMREYSEKVLMGILEDDSWFAYVCGLDPCEKCFAEGKTQPNEECKDCDDWRDEKVWIKANPNLGVSLTKKYLQEQVREAVGMPAKQSIVKRLNFCVWTQQAERVIPMDKWDSCAKPLKLEDFHGRPCFAGLDIGAMSDFTAFVLVFPHDDGEPIEVPVDYLNPEGEKRTINRRSFSVFSWFWLPEFPVKRDGKMEEVINEWRNSGMIRTTPGNVVDYDMVLDDMLRIVKPFSITNIAFDRGFQGSQMGTNMMKHWGEEIVKQFPQGIVSMNAPFRELLELLSVGRIYHDGHPVLRWMASNVAKEERGGLMKPSKDMSPEKIDGITAGVMALGAAMLDPGAGESIYETSGNLSL